MPRQKTVIKSVKKEGFVTLSNHLVRDKRLTFKARGILALVLSCTDEWEVTQKWLVDQTPEGREAVSSAFKELEKHGYCTYQEARTEDGRVHGAVWMFYEEPVALELRTQRTNHSNKNGKPTHGKPCHGKPSHGNDASKKDYREEVPSVEKTIRPPTVPQTNSRNKNKPADRKEVLEFCRCNEIPEGVGLAFYREQEQREWIDVRDWERLLLHHHRSKTYKDAYRPPQQYEVVEPPDLMEIIRQRKERELEESGRVRKV